MKKVAIGMAVLALCAGMAMAHKTITYCDTPGCTVILSETRANRKTEKNKSCGKCSTLENEIRSGKCTKHQNYCEVLEDDANNGDERAKGLWYDNCKPSN